jgi:hypothetical protein
MKMIMAPNSPPPSNKYKMEYPIAASSTGAIKVVAIAQTPIRNNELVERQQTTQRVCRIQNRPYLPDEQALLRRTEQSE